jgi:hypothetical protein
MHRSRGSIVFPNQASLAATAVMRAVGPNSNEWRRQVCAHFKTFVLVAVVWAVICSVILLQFGPIHPQGKYQWALFVVFGPPAYVLFEGLAELVFSKQRGHRSGSKPGYGDDPQSFSFKRVLTGVSIVIAIVIIFVGVSWLVSKY